MSVSSILNFFRPKVLFNSSPGFLSGANLTILLAVFGILFVAGIVVTILIQARKKDHILVKALRRLQANFFTVSLVGFLYAWLAYENVYILSMRFWLVILFLVFAAWFVYGLYNLIKRVPNYKADRQRQREFEKYLP
ncbi:MAG: hypothetical protein COT81_02140 [Candidatus Buchananbacteria bacterium CG10_big_fil_rev_8_21_14_0_10_42_9]|uniref:Uncharacterized protein n=1 Tax=Candidatus Buchananbacteria bacterium CG10_big_fil_rev_8_21_14_0_10_42_9 TaxID=1974526 RepID=A0A2H0W3L4_9BACT|nr:MAG: hypothetical protein COT81_02140 [Candidatus Buchananbacteria bacterium CG10_big_fil_rev_8_21_14_0_10_42_9]